MPTGVKPPSPTPLMSEGDPQQEGSWLTSKCTSPASPGDFKVSTPVLATSPSCMQVIEKRRSPLGPFPFACETVIERDVLESFFWPESPRNSVFFQCSHPSSSGTSMYKVASPFNDGETQTQDLHSPSNHTRKTMGQTAEGSFAGNLSADQGCDHFIISPAYTSGSESLFRSHCLQQFQTNPFPEVSGPVRISRWGWGG